MSGDCGHGWGYHFDGPTGPCYKCKEEETKAKTNEQLQKEIERLNARVKELESNNGKPFVIIDHQDNYSLWLVKNVDGLIKPLGETSPIRIPSGWYAEITKDKYK